MSRASKLTLVATGLGATGMIAFVHWAQEAERAQMHKGVERDEVRSTEKERVRRERQADFDMQKALEQEYRKLQNVPDNTIDGQGRGEKSVG